MTSSIPSPPITSQAGVSKSPSRSTVAAAAVASVLGFFLIVGIVVYIIWTRRRRHWWQGEGIDGFGIVHAEDPAPRHRRIRSNEIVDVMHAHPGRGLSVPASLAIPYNYRSIADNDGTLETGYGRGDDMDSDSGHGHGQKKPATSLHSMPSFDNLPRERPTSISPTRLSTHRRSRSLTISKWSGWFGTPTRASFPSVHHQHPSIEQQATMADVPIVAPQPTRVLPPVSVLARAHVRDNQSFRSSSVGNATVSDAFLDLRRTSPFQVDFAKDVEAHSCSTPEPVRTYLYTRHFSQS